jgi:PKD domain/PA14 domain
LLGETLKQKSAFDLVRSLQKTITVMLPAAALLCAATVRASKVVPVPEELRTQRFTVKVDGKEGAFAHAATSYYYLSLDLPRKGRVRITISAPSYDYWARGVEVQPWRENIRPSRSGRDITFSLDHPAQLSIARPGDHLGGAEMLFVFANAPEKHPPAKASSSLRYYGPGVYHENIDAHHGDNIYLAPGAVVFGSINIWQVDNVRIFGRGTVVYDGPQDPRHDTGWMHKPNWHVLVMDNAHHIEINGITLVTRSRAWMIQMKDSRFIEFDNVKVIGGCEGNANQDGMDWLGGGDTVVRNSFFRASDDIFAMYGNWDGYEPDVLMKPGHEVSNIRIENSVLSTGISNVVRVNWPRKTFDSHNFLMRDVDVIHMGVGGCGVPFALMEIWADPAGHGDHSNYHFENIRLEDWYSLVQLLQPNPRIHDISFRNVWALDSPQMVPSTLEGSVDGVHLENVKVANKPVLRAADLPLQPLPESRVTYETSPEAVQAEFKFGPADPTAGQKIAFDASSSHSAIGGKLKYLWLFGDGTSAKGKVVRHAMPDTEGTLHDGSGRFRVLLKVTDGQGNVDWFSRPVVVRNSLNPAAAGGAGLKPGLRYKFYQGEWTGLPDFQSLQPVGDGTTDTLSPDVRQHSVNYGYVFEGYVRAPIDGGYVFDFLGRDAGRLEIDGQTIAESPAVWPQVCGSVGNSVQMASGSVGLRAGLHQLRVSMTQKAGDDAFAVDWQGPDLPLTPIARTDLFSAPDASVQREQ